MSDLLGHIVEFSIGLAGFSGVVAVFSTYRSEWVELHRWRIRNLLLFSIGPGFLALIALGLLKILDETVAWRIATFTSAIYALIVFFFAFRSRAALSENERAQISTGAFMFFTLLLSVSSFAQVIAAVGLITEYSSSAFYFGLILILLIGIYQFFRAVLEGLRINSDQ